MATVIKFSFEGATHRVLLEEGGPSYASIQQAIRKTYPDKSFTIMYRDEENDLCTLCEATLPDCLSLASESQGRKLLKLELATDSKSAALPKEASAAGSSNDGGKAEGAAASAGPPLAALMKQLGEELRNGLGSAGNSSADAQAEGGAAAATPPLATLLKNLIPLQQLGEELRNGFADQQHPRCRRKRSWDDFAQQNTSEDDDQPWKPQQVMSILAQLHREQALNSKSFAAVLTHNLAQLIAVLAENGETLDWMMVAFLPQIRPLLEDLRVMADSTQGLEECVPLFASLLAGEDSSLMGALLSLLTALDLLPFENQVAFFDQLYVQQEKHLLNIVGMTSSFMPPIPGNDALVTCDGCNKHPLKGLRFKCKTRADYDLCADCYCNKCAILDGNGAADEFEMLLVAQPWMAHMLGKGFGKGKMFKGMFKGKGHGKGKWWGKGKAKGKWDAEGWGTWHPTHWEDQQAADIATKAEEQTTDVTMKPEGEAESKDVAMQAPDFSFPVIVEDGRCLTIQWNKDDDLTLMAKSFSADHNIPTQELPTIQAFMEAHTAAATKPRDKETSTEAGADAPQEDLKEQAQMVEEMGLCSKDAFLELVQSNGGNVQTAIDALLKAQSS